MRDKDLVALLTLVFSLLYFIPITALKFVSVGFLLFFAPGFFTLKLYRDISREETLLISPPLSLAISGTMALLLAALSILNKETMLLTLGAFIAAMYLLSHAETIHWKPQYRGLDKLAAMVLILSIILSGVWIYSGLNVEHYKEVDMAIESWPHNATLNSTLSFVIYVKNWDFQNGEFRIVFKLNNESIDEREFSLDNGGEDRMVFQANATQIGENLASFDLYVNGEFYSNVHVYFIVKP